MKYYIVNEIDRPYERLVAGEYNGKLYYLSRALEHDLKNCDGMGLDCATPMEDFGFDVSENDNSVVFNLNHPSKVKYKSVRTGEEIIRPWQGMKDFSLPLLDIEDLNRYMKRRK
jgi:hypothetical protein